jgi:hypothetical protein
MSRRHSEEPTFSTDSFLDVVCNLVGILIILIIVAGMRVTGAPVSLDDDEPTPAAPINRQPPARPIPVQAAIKLAELGHCLERAPAAPTEPAPPEQPPADLVEQEQQLRQLIAQLTAQNTGLKERASAARETRQATEEKLRDLAVRVESDKSQSQERDADADKLARKILELEEQVSKLKSESVEIAAQPVQAHVLTHSVTPISRQVSEKDEIHFRLAGNRVSVVPLESLAEALKLRMQRSGDLFIRLDRYEGSAGPVDGYLMHYVIEKRAPSAIEELRNGGSFLRIQLTYYELEVRKDAVSESIDEALSPGSKFMTTLLAARPGTSLTFWVYPDSFEAHRKLQEFAHEARFEVAARPLPFGVPIAGSPHGSRSAAQ